jgi:hypothetical protein
MKSFGTSENADTFTLHDVCDRYNTTRTASPIVLLARCVPIMTSTLLPYRATQVGRASGTEGEILALYKLASHPMARLYHPLYVKMALSIQEPLASKWGLMFSFLKGLDSPPAFLQSLRAVTLGQVGAKSYHEIERERLEPSLSECALDTMRWYQWAGH